MKAEASLVLPLAARKLSPLLLPLLLLLLLLLC